MKTISSSRSYLILICMLYFNCMYAQYASISNEYYTRDETQIKKKKPRSEWPRVSNCLDPDSFAISRINYNGKVYLSLDKLTNSNTWAIGKPENFPQELQNKYFKYTVVTSNSETFELTYWESIGGMTSQFNAIFPIGSIWGHEVMGMKTQDNIIKIKLEFFTRSEDCLHSELYCNEEFEETYATYNSTPNYINYFSCNQAEYSICQVVNNINGKINGADLNVTIDNLTNDDFQRYVSESQVYEIGIEIKAYSGANTETRFINIPVNASFNIEHWQENLIGFGGYSEYRVTVFYKVFDSVEFVSCEEEIELPVNTSTELCQLLNLLQHKQVGDTLVWSFNHPENSNYYIEAIANLGITAAQAQAFYQLTDAIDFDLEFINNGGATNRASIHHAIGTDSLFNLSIKFLPMDFNDLHGKLNITYYYNIDGIENCSFLPFEYKNENPPNGVLKDYECGTNYTVASGNTSQNYHLQVGDVFEVNGLTCQVKSLTNNSNTGPYNGTGIISLPFTKKRLKVTFDGVIIDNTYLMTAGTVLGIRATPGSYPNFLISPDTIALNGDICKVIPNSEKYDEDGFDKVTGLNARGFNKQGIHHKTGTKYDENGFDINGIHENGTKYNQFGCNVEGLDSLGMPCESTITQDELKAFIDSNLAFIDSVTFSQFNGLLGSWQDSLQLLNCSNDSLALVGLINSSSAINSDNRQYIEGRQKEYISPQLSNLFSEEPKVITQDNTRDEIIKNIEKKHIELYRCDKERVRYIKMLQTLEGYTEDEIKNYIKSKLSELSAYQVDQFKKDRTALIDWVIFILNGFITPQTGIGHIEKSNKLFESSPSNNYQNSSPYYSLASANNNTINQGVDKKIEEYWLFDQGFQEINGVSRGYYLQELYNQMMMEGYADSTEVPMPLQLLKMEDGIDYSIYLDNFRLTPTNATVSAYFILTLPESSKKILLKAENISFGPSGLTGIFKLKLESTLEIRVTNNALLRIFPSNTYVDWDCNGFKGLNINGEVELCRGVVIPLDPVKLTPLPEPERLKIEFDTYVQKWNDIYISFNPNGTAKPFVITGYDKIQWTFNNIVLDLSDYRSPTNITYPTGYKDPFSQTSGANTLSPQWRGFAVNLLQGRVPGILNQSQPKTIAVQNLLIDDTGVSVSVSVSSQILGLNEGNLDGWPISINKFHISILNNQFLKGGFGGALKVSILRDTLNYSATFFEDGALEFTFSSFGSQNIPMFLADAKLDDNSSLSIYLKDSVFTAVATLHGSLHVNCSFLNVKDITFKDFKVSNQAPYFDAGTWGMKDSIGFKLFGFGINIHNIQPISYTDEEPGLAFNLDLNLVEKLGINASGGFVIRGQFSEISNIQSFTFNKLELDSLTVDVSFSAGHLTGSLYKFEEHATYGTGFFGGVELELRELFTVKAYGQFGKVSDSNGPYKYFYVDANLELEKGIPAFGPLELKGFSGGLSYAMTQQLDPNAAPLSQNQKPSLGQSANGIVRFYPNSQIGLGLSAGVLLSFKGQETLFKGSVELRVEFNSLNNGGGLNNIALNGSGVFMTKDQLSNQTSQDTTASPYSSTPLAAHLRIKYNFDQKELHGEFKVFLNIPNLLTGAGTNNKLVNAEVHFTRSDWWVYIGLPKSPAGVNMNLYGFGSINFGLYFDMGTKVPEMREIPSEVTSIIGNIDRKTPFAEMTRGFVFGAYLTVGANLNFGIASGYLHAGLGFDISLREYKGVSCGSYDPIGFDGWYARGQVYAYLNGGIRFLGVEVLNAGVAAVMQSRMPRPFFAQAALGVKVKIGPFKVKKTLNIEIGDKCSFTSSSNNTDIGFDVISDISPMEGANDIKNNEHVIVSFGMKPGTIYEVPQLSGSGVDKFIANIKSQNLTNQDGFPIPYEEVFNTETELHLIPKIWFDAGDTLYYTIEVEVMKNGSLLTTIKDTTHFVVRGLLDYIPLENIAAAYPYDGMANYYRNEFNQYKGIIQLNQGMPQLFYNIPDGYSQNMKLTSYDGSHKIFEYTYDPINRQITFPIDPEWVEKGKGYKLELVRYPKGKYESTLPSKNSDFNSHIRNLGNNPLNVPPSNSDEGSDGSEISMYTAYFRASLFEDLGSKLNAMQYAQNTNQYIPVNEGFTASEIEYLVTLTGKVPQNTGIFETYSNVTLDVIVNYGGVTSLSSFSCEEFKQEPPQDYILFNNAKEIEIGANNYNTNLNIGVSNQSLANYLQGHVNTGRAYLIDWIDRCVDYAIFEFNSIETYTVQGPASLTYALNNEVTVSGDIEIKYEIPGFNTLSRIHVLKPTN